MADHTNFAEPLTLADLRPNGGRLFRRPQLRALGITYSSTHLKRMRRAGTFPEPVRLAPGNRSHCAWRESDLWSWWQGRVAEIDRPPSGVKADGGRKCSLTCGFERDDENMLGDVAQEIGTRRSG